MDVSCGAKEGSTKPSSVQRILNFGTARFFLGAGLFPRQTVVIFIVHSFPNNRMAVSRPSDWVQCGNCTLATCFAHFLLGARKRTVGGAYLEEDRAT